MASVKEYAYFLKGNKVALVERDANFDNDVNSRDYGPGANRTQWKSPLSDVTRGLEIEHTYIPEYWLNGSRSIGFRVGVNFNETHTSVYYSVYGDKEGYFTLFFPTHNDSFSGGNLNMSTLTAGNYIVVHNHPQFNGVHKIKEASANGHIETYTKWNSNLGEVERDDTSGYTVVYEQDDDSITMTNSPEAFNGISAGDYIFIPAADSQVRNEGLFKVSSVNTGGLHGVLKVDTQYYIDRTVATPKGTLTGVASSIQDQTDSTANWNARQVLLCEGAYVDVLGVNVLNDEEDYIDLRPYQVQALESYIRAKLAMDIGEVQLYEYHMKEFRKKLEKDESGRIRGARLSAAGPHSIR